LQLEKEEGSVSSITSTLADQIASYFAPQIISYEYVKKGLLMAAANAGIHNDDKRIPKRMRINSLLIGDPSLAKSTFIRKIAEIVPNARYESCQSSTGLSLTAQVSREEGGIFTLRHGPISLANGSLCALNEIGQMHISEHKHFLDCMQEGQFTLNKYGFNAPISANTSIIASANPINNTWKDPENIEQNEFPTLTQIIHRFDFIFIFIENTDPGYLRDYVRRREANAKLSSQGAFDNYDNFLRKYLMYARTFNPAISDEAREMLDDYWINMGSAGVRGLPRKLESLESAAIALAKLKLKDVVEAEDVTEIMEFFNVILLHFRQTAAVSKNPRNIAYEECVDVLKSSKFAISYEEVVKSACHRNDKVGRYIGDKHTLAHNKKLRPILELLINHSHIIQTGQRPVALQWTDTERNTNSSNSLLSDLSDLSDLDVHDTDENNLQGSILNHDNKVLDKDENIKNGSDESRSDRSYRSDTKPKLPTVTTTSISQQPIISVEEFFYDNPNTPWEPLPTHNLEQSPCRLIIAKKGTFYSCKLHPKEANNIYLDAIEQHCKYKYPEVHKAEILRLLETGASS
jgi:DNA replicative helicase MCM subunit Mcm2 (Cdc46/Mcm family)